MKKTTRVFSVMLSIMLILSVAGAATAETTATTNALAETAQGWLIGTNENGVNCFLGIPYATAERFQSPVRYDAWQGLRAALVYGESAPTGATTMPVTDYMTKTQSYVENENCLYLNVWSPSLDTDAKKAVVFFIHGGGFSSGSSNELVYYTGKNMAGTQDIVFVSINHRLNILGYTDLSNYGDEYKYSGNAGQQDIVMALEWVRENIAAFGGDPDNVTIMGQSGGGSKVTTLMGTPSAVTLFDKAVILSGGGRTTQTTEISAAAGTALVEKTKETYDDVTTDEEAIAKLTTISYIELAALATDTGVGAGPTVDGDFYPESTIGEDGTWVDLCKDIPMITSTTLGEFAGNIANNTISALINNVTLYMENPQETYVPSVNKDYMTEEQKDAMLEAKYGDQKDEVVAAFLEAYPNKEPVDVLYMTARNNNQAIGKALQGGANVYQSVFSWEFPCFGGVPAWHTGGDLPFIFNNVDTILYLVGGNEAEAQKIADEASTAFANFAKTGDPSQDGLAWPAFTIEEGATMLFDSESNVRSYHDETVQELVNGKTTTFADIRAME